MLIRICDHFRNNPKRIDKLIAIKGLPDEWLFREGAEGRELRKPWEADVDGNIPMDIRQFCEPMYITIKYSPIEKGSTGLIDRRQIFGIKIDYNSEPGRQMWDDVERYIEETIPRHERVPVPVVCAKDEKSPFETYTPRRTAQGSLEFVPAQVPFVDLTKYDMKSAPAPAPAPVITAEPAAVLKEAVEPAPVEPEPEHVLVFDCTECDRTFKTQTALKIHQSRPRNHIKEKAGATK